MGNDNIKGGVKFIVELVTTKQVSGLIFGKYSDGTPRSLTDALNGEYLSPREKKHLFYSKKKKKKNKKKHKKNSNVKWISF